MPASVPATRQGGAASVRKPSPIAELFREHGDDFLERRTVTPGQAKVLRAIQRCRTAALGGHMEVCDSCDFSRPAYNSCRDRHCPVCQALAQHRWLSKRLDRVLPAPHFHVVFTLPAELRPLALRNPKAVLDILFASAWSVLDRLGRQRLGGRIGVTMVLHTWTRAMLYHPHVHCIVTGGALVQDDEGERWNPSHPRFLFPIAVMRKMFRGTVRDKLLRAHRRGELDLGGACAGWEEIDDFERMFRGLFAKDWVVYAKRPFAGVEQVFTYLGQYTHRVAISDYRILASDGSTVTVKTKGAGKVTLTPFEFIRRFLLHVLPPGFHKIRHYGLYSGAHVRRLLPVARALLAPEPAASGDEDQERAESWEELVEKLSDDDPRKCPCCEAGVLLRYPLTWRPHLATAREPDDTS